MGAAIKVATDEAIEEFNDEGNTVRDPHVKALHYRIEHAETVMYESPKPLRHEEAGFTVQLEDSRAVIEMKDHHPSRESAREAVEGFLSAWELKSALESGQDSLQFTYERADMIDRNPEPGVVVLYAEAAQVAIQGGDVSFRMNLTSFPPPPTDMAVDADVEFLFAIYQMFRQGTRTLSDAAYLSLTVLERRFRGAKDTRKAAAQHFGIDKNVLINIGKLTGEKGGLTARKAKGIENKYTAAESQFLQSAMTTIIRRASEVAYDPGANKIKITLADLPQI